MLKIVLKYDGCNFKDILFNCVAHKVVLYLCNMVNYQKICLTVNVLLVTT